MVKKNEESKRAFCNTFDLHSKANFLSFFEWLLKTGFTVVLKDILPASVIDRVILPFRESFIFAEKKTCENF